MHVDDTISLLRQRSATSLKGRLQNLEMLVDEKLKIGWRAQVTFSADDATAEDLNLILQQGDVKRLLLIGPPGAGKSTDIMQAAKSVMDAKCATLLGASVALLVSVAGWDPGIQPLREWVLSQTERQLSEVESAEIEQLLNSGAIAIILDGVDEIHYSGRALSVLLFEPEVQIPDTWTLVVTCREQEYENIAADGDFVAWTVYRSETPSLDELAIYLTSVPPVGGATKARQQEKWAPVIGHMRNCASDDDVLTSVLRTPLYAWLARTVYMQAVMDPAGMLQLLKSATRLDLERQLFEHYLFLAPPSGRSHKFDSNEYGRRMRRWYARLAFLAAPERPSLYNAIAYTAGVRRSGESILVAAVLIAAIFSFSGGFALAGLVAVVGAILLTSSSLEFASAFSPYEKDRGPSFSRSVAEGRRQLLIEVAGAAWGAFLLWQQLRSIDLEGPGLIDLSTIIAAAAATSFAALAGDFLFDRVPARLGVLLGVVAIAVAVYGSSGLWLSLIVQGTILGVLLGYGYVLESGSRPATRASRAAFLLIMSTGATLSAGGLVRLLELTSSDASRSPLVVSACVVALLKLLSPLFAGEGAPLFATTAFTAGAVVLTSLLDSLSLAVMLVLTLSLAAFVECPGGRYELSRVKSAFLGWSPLSIESLLNDAERKGIVTLAGEHLRFRHEQLRDLTTSQDDPALRRAQRNRQRKADKTRKRASKTWLKIQRDARRWRTGSFSSDFYTPLIEKAVRNSRAAYERGDEREKIRRAEDVARLLAKVGDVEAIAKVGDILMLKMHTDPIKYDAELIAREAAVWYLRALARLDASASEALEIRLSLGEALCDLELYREAQELLEADARRGDSAAMSILRDAYAGLDLPELSAKLTRSLALMGDSRAIRRLAFEASIEGDHRRAEAHYASLVEDDYSPTLIDVGQEQMKQGRPAAARETWEVAAQAGQTEAKRRLAELAIEQYNLDAAETLIREWEQKHPPDRLLRALYADAAMRVGREAYPFQDSTGARD